MPLSAACKFEGERCHFNLTVGWSLVRLEGRIGDDLCRSVFALCPVVLTAKPSAPWSRPPLPRLWVSVSRLPSSLGSLLLLGWVLVGEAPVPGRTRTAGMCNHSLLRHSQGLDKRLGPGCAAEHLLCGAHRGGCAAPPVTCAPQQAVLPASHDLPHFFPTVLRMLQQLSASCQEEAAPWQLAQQQQRWHSRASLQQPAREQLHPSRRPGVTPSGPSTR